MLRIRQPQLGTGTAGGDVTGTLAATEAADAFAGSGTFATTGSMAATEGADVFAGTGSYGPSGSMAATEGVDTFAGTGSVGSPITGTLAATEAPDVFFANGINGNLRPEVWWPGSGPVSGKKKRHREPTYLEAQWIYEQIRRHEAKDAPAEVKEALAEAKQIVSNAVPRKVRKALARKELPPPSSVDWASIRNDVVAARLETLRLRILEAEQEEEELLLLLH